MSCDEVCPAKIELKPKNALTRPPKAPPHLSSRYAAEYRAWGYLPIAPYPPGGTPHGGATGLNISADEWARLARESPCAKCLLEEQVRDASKLHFSWAFWAGLGAGALGLGMLVMGRKK